MQHHAPMSPVTSPSKGNRYPDLLHIVLPDLELYIHGATQFLLFIVCGFLLSIVCDPSEFIQQFVHSHCCMVFCCGRGPQHIHSMVAGHVGCPSLGLLHIALVGMSIVPLLGRRVHIVNVSTSSQIAL